jgi:hypothetical protein
MKNPMRPLNLLVTLISALLISSPQALAQNFGGSSLGFSGMAGYLGFGVAEFTVLNPSANFRMDQGTYVYLAGEKEIGMTGLFITISINYMQSAGQSFYDYTTLGGVNYSNVAPQIDFDSDHLDLGLGFKFKIFPTSFLGPMVKRVVFLGIIPLSTILALGILTTETVVNVAVMV